jgi:hypothetical protein
MTDIVKQDRTRMIAAIERAPAHATLVAADFHDKGLVVSAVPGAGGPRALIQIARTILDTACDLLVEEEDAAPNIEAAEPIAELHMQVKDALSLLPDMHDDEDNEDEAPDA